MTALTSAVPVIDVWPIGLAAQLPVLTALIPVIDGWRIGLAPVLAAGGALLALDAGEGIVGGVALRGVTGADGNAVLGATIWTVGAGLEIAAGKL